MLDWEKDRRRRLPKEAGFDDLPTTGSWSDRKRWIRENDYPQLRVETRQKKARPQLTEIQSSDTQQLQMYVACVNAAYFHDKSLEHRQEIIRNLMVLAHRIQSSTNPISHATQELLARANKCIRILRHRYRF